MKDFIKLILLVVMTVCGWGEAAQALDYPPQPSGHIVDLDKAIYEFTVDELNNDLAQFKQEQNIGIYVLFVSSLGGKSAELSALQVFERWKLGGEEENALLMLLSREDKDIGIYVGSGISKRLTQSEATHIIETYIKPKFDEVNYNDAVFMGVHQFKKALLTNLASTTGIFDNLGVKALIFIGLAFLLLLGVILYGKLWLMIVSVLSLGCCVLAGYFTGMWHFTLNIMYLWLFLTLALLIWMNLPSQQDKKQPLSKSSNDHIEQFKFSEGEGDYGYQDYDDIHGDMNNKYSADSYKASRWERDEDQDGPSR